MKKLTASPFIELPAFITVKEAARVLRLGMTKMYRMIRENKIPHIRSNNKGNAQILVPVLGLKTIMTKAAGFDPDLNSAILDAINSPDVKRRRGRPPKKGMLHKPLLTERPALKITEGSSSTVSIESKSEEKPRTFEMSVEDVIIEYARVFRLFLSSAIELQTFKNETIAKAIDALEGPEGDNLASDKRSTRKTFTQLRAVYKKLGRKVNLLYAKLPGEILPALKDPSEIKKSLLSNLIYREDLSRYINRKATAPRQADTSCDKIINNLIEIGFFGQDRDFGSILAEVLKTEMICSDKSIRKAIKKAVVSGRLNARGYGKGTKYTKRKSGIPQ